jgi:hypothetical protein
MSVLVNKPSQLSAATGTAVVSVDLILLETKVNTLTVHARWKNKANWKSVEFIYENAAKQRYKIVFKIDQNKLSFLIDFLANTRDGMFSCVDLNIAGYNSDFLEIDRAQFLSLFGSTNIFDINVIEGYGYVTPPPPVGDKELVFEIINSYYGNSNPILAYIDSVTLEGNSFLAGRISYTNVVNSVGTNVLAGSVSAATNPFGSSSGQNIVVNDTHVVLESIAQYSNIGTGFLTLFGKQRSIQPAYDDNISINTLNEVLRDPAETLNYPIVYNNEFYASTSSQVHKLNVFTVDGVDYFNSAAISTTGQYWTKTPKVFFNSIYYVTSTSLYKTDGVTFSSSSPLTGVVIKDQQEYLYYFNGYIYYTQSGSQNRIARIDELNNIVVLPSVNGSGGTNYWSLGTYFRGFKTIDNNLYCVLYNGTGTKLAKIDTSDNITLISNTNSSHDYPDHIIGYNGFIFFTARGNDNFRRVYYLDNTNTVFEIANSKGVTGLFALENKLIFTIPTVVSQGLSAKTFEIDSTLNIVEINPFIDFFNGGDLVTLKNGAVGPFVNHPIVDQNEGVYYQSEAVVFNGVPTSTTATTINPLNKNQVIRARYRYI